MARDGSHRYRGHTDAGSWTACILARMGGAACVAGLALTLTCLAPAAARAISHGHAGNPSPQRAPVSSPGSPAPDPAPGSTTSHPSTPSTPSIRVTKPAVSAGNRITPTSSPAAPAGTSSVPSVSTGAVSRSAPTPSSVHARPRHAATVRPTSPRVGPLSFPLALPRDLLLLPRAALRASVRSRENGLLLLLSAAAMAIVAVASFALLRRLRRLVAA
jgi:hypothetical protein